LAAPNPTSRPYLRQRSSGVFWHAKWSRNGHPVVRSLGRAWVEPDGRGGWRRRRGRAAADCLTEAQAHERMLVLVREHHADQELLEHDEFERRRRGVTFREVALDYLDWLRDVRGAKPSTLRAVQSNLAEPGIAYKRGNGVTAGQIMKALGDRPAARITMREINLLLREASASSRSRGWLVHSSPVRTGIQAARRRRRRAGGMGGAGRPRCRAGPRRRLLGTAPRRARHPALA